MSGLLDRRSVCLIVNMTSNIFIGATAKIIFSATENCKSDNTSHFI